MLAGPRRTPTTRCAARAGMGAGASASPSVPVPSLPNMPGATWQVRTVSRQPRSTSGCTMHHAHASTIRRGDKTSSPQRTTAHCPSAACSGEKEGVHATRCHYSRQLTGRGVYPTVRHSVPAKFMHTPRGLRYNYRDMRPFVQTRDSEGRSIWHVYCRSRVLL